MNTFVVIDRKGEVLDWWETKYTYEVGETIIVDSSIYCKCKEVRSELENNTYIFVQGWIEYGF